MTRYEDDCQNARFIDVDFPDLMKRKQQTVLSTEELRDPLTDLETRDDSPVLLTSKEYVQIGVDLRRTDILQASLASVVDISNCCFLFVAEVSITYMETEGADNVIQWAQTLGDGR
jgi:tRNA wybutosine-synthesizing protein 4